MDEGKVKAMNKWAEPTTVKELQRFLSFANFYFRFIKDISTMAAPLMSLLKAKPKHLKITPDDRTAFQRLKGLFTTAAVLKFPDPAKPFVVEVDASEIGLGGVLSQYYGDPRKLHPCAYFSRNLTEAERNYNIANLELLEVKAALEVWCHWLEGARHTITVFIDHRN